MIPKTFRKWIYANPLVDGELTLHNFQMREEGLPALPEGHALVRVKLLNVHAATRQRMKSGATALGDTDHSNYACGEVVASRDPAFREGDIIACQAGWQEYQIISSSVPSVGYSDPGPAVKALNRTNSQWTYVFRPELAARWLPSVLMDIFGTSGMTAWFGLRACGLLSPLDVIAVSGTTGSVGSIAAQLAQAAGGTVIGFAGSKEGYEWVMRDLKIEHCFDYHAHDLSAQLRSFAPGGLHVVLDGVGGSLAARLLEAMSPRGRMISYGFAADLYGPVSSRSPSTSLRAHFGITREMEEIIVARQIYSDAWIVDKFYDERLRAEDDLSRLLEDGLLTPITNTVLGFENLPETIVSLYGRSRFGKLQISFEP